MILPAPDKLAHALVGGVVCAWTVIAAVLWGYGPWQALAWAAAACAIAAVGREVYNRSRGGRFDVADIAWTLAGGAVAIAPSAVLAGGA